VSPSGAICGSAGGGGGGYYGGGGGSAANSTSNANGPYAGGGGSGYIIANEAGFFDPPTYSAYYVPGGGWDPFWNGTAGMAGGRNTVASGDGLIVIRW
jgi:hypothetical protein